MNKKILLLGGSHGQIPAIQEAKRRGLHTILCDYLPDNPGQHLADEFFLASTTDQDKILEIAQDKQIDLILSYCSDPAVKTTAYVSSQMGLKGNSPESVKILSNKDKFRAFQKENDFHAPRFEVITDPQTRPKKEYEDLLPTVVKPVDGSDTKGVSLIYELSELQDAVKYAFQFTRCGRVIIEEKIDAVNGDLSGDGFFVNGELYYCELGEHIFTATSNPLKPCCSLFPSQIDVVCVKRVKEQVAELTRKTGYKNGPVNIEARINSAGDIYIMEIGPRNGGNYIPRAIYHATGFNMLEALFDLWLDEEIQNPTQVKRPAICFTLHSNESGIFESFHLHERLQPYLAEQHLYIKRGDKVDPYSEANSSLGSLLFRFENYPQLQQQLENFYQDIIAGVRLRNLGE